MTDRSLWRNRDFMLLWVAQAVSQTAQNAVNYGLMVLVQTRTGSSAQMSLAVLTVVLPSVLFGLVAGAYVDRRDKRWVLIGTNVLRAASMLGYILFADQLALVYLANFLFSTISQFFAPAEMAMIPALVERRRLVQANSLFHVTFTAAQLGGLVLFGPLVVNLVGLDGLFLLVAVALAACALLVWPLPTTYRPAEQPVAGFAALWSDVREVLGFVRTDRLLTWAVGHWTLGATLALVLATLAPAFAVDVLGVRAEDSVFVMSPGGLGMVLGAAILSRWGARFDKRLLIDAAVVALGLALGFMAVVGGAWEWLVGIAIGADGGPVAERSALVGAVMLTALLAGVAFVAVVVPAQTVIQERAPTEVRGRVFAVQLVLSNVASIVPLMLLGGLADLIGVERTLLLLGLLVVGVGLTGARRPARKEAPPEPEPAA